MKTTIETEDDYEARRMLKSLDMALCLWEIVHNTWRQFKNSDIDYQPIFEAITEELDKHNINLDDLIE